MIRDTTAYLLDAVEANQRLLFEGAQGALLDIDHGTFPFVTSSNSSGLGVSAGSGVPGRWVDRVIGVIKTYSTRVGGGPFPTELENETGEQLRSQGGEFGATTGRARRCGWFDSVIARYSAQINGLTGLALTKLDVLDGFETIRVCTRYRLGEQILDTFPHDVDDVAAVEPVYEDLPGWQQSTVGITQFEDLPQKAKDYIAYLEDRVGVPVDLVSTGQKRNEIIFRRNPFSAYGS